MDDRTLLELAAMAAGVDLRRLPDAWPEVMEPVWSPLTDDGDAMRLAAALLISVHFFDGKTIAMPRFGWDVSERHGDEQYGGDVAAATRRAIVRSAAEIWREMQ